MRPLRPLTKGVPRRRVATRSRTVAGLVKAVATDTIAFSKVAYRLLKVAV